MIVLLQIVGVCVRERILKIGEYLVNMRTRVLCQVF